MSDGAAERSVTEIEEESPCRVISRKRGREGVFASVRPNDKVQGGDVLVVDTAASWTRPAVRFRIGGK